jgi:hypothetical protein
MRRTILLAMLAGAAWAPASPRPEVHRRRTNEQAKPLERAARHAGSTR